MCIRRISIRAIPQLLQHVFTRTENENIAQHWMRAERSEQLVEIERSIFSDHQIALIDARGIARIRANIDVDAGAARLLRMHRTADVPRQHVAERIRKQLKV